MSRHKPVPGHEVQQRVYGHNCFGCGPANDCGLKLEFHLNEDHKRIVCEFVLAQRFEGPPSHAHGGIIAVTGTMQVNYIRPVPLAEQLVTEGWEVGINGREHFRAAEIRNPQGEILATSTGIFIEVDPARMWAKFLNEKQADAT